MKGTYFATVVGLVVAVLYLSQRVTAEATCDFDEFMCNNGECKPQSYVCDRSNDCGDNSDEVGCENHCLSYEFICDNGQCAYEGAECDGYNDCGDKSDENGCESDVNVGLTVGLSVGLVFLILLIGVPLCIVMGVYCLSRRSNRPVQTHVVATAPMAGATTVVTSSQAGTSTTAPDPLQPAYADTQFSSPSAPSTYPDATAYPQAAQGYNKYQPNSAAAYPQQQNASYPPQNPAYPQAVPYSNQAQIWPIPQHDGGTEELYGSKNLP